MATGYTDQAAPPQKMEGEREFTEAQVEESGRLMEEMPRIEAALKNYLSLKMAEGLVLDEQSDDAKGQVAASISPAALQGCARVLLKTLNSIQLPTAPEWSQRHPQGKEEPAMDFLSRVGSYKVVRVLWEKCKDPQAGKPGVKPAKMLGKSALKFVLPEVTSKLLADAQASAADAKAGELEFRSFISGFEATLNADAADPVSEAALVWCVDMKAALAARQQARQADAEERVARQKSAETFTDEMRATLSGHVPPNSSSGVHIEEVEE